VYRPDARDIHYELPVSPWEAALGTTVEVPTLGGGVKLKVPPNSQSGNRLRLKGRGLPGDPPGDQYVTLRVVLPRADSPEHRALYQQMADTMNFDPRAAEARTSS
jgi:curved DNA-binding protein